MTTLEEKNLEPKDRVAAYISLYKQQMERAAKTQDIEWKGNFGVWALLAGAIYFAAREHVVALSCRKTEVMLALVIIVHTLWLLRIHGSFAFDKKLWDGYRTKTLEIIEPGATQGKPYKRSWFAESVWILLEVGMTTILSLVLLVILFFR